jgi:polar amino acid transport system substrate-binding protein
MDLFGQFEDKMFNFDKVFRMKWIFLYLCVTCLNFASATTPDIKICYEDVTVYPWILGDDKGLVINELHIVERNLKIKFTMIRLPWKRCQSEAQMGNIDGIIAASFNQERTQWGIYPSNHDEKIERDYRLHTDSFYVYTKKESPIKWSNGKFENLGTSSIGVQLGYSVGSDITKMGYPIHSSFTDTKDIFKELDLGIINVAVLQDYESLTYLSNNPILAKKVHRQEPPFKVADQFLLMTKNFYAKNQILTKEIWAAIKDARNSEEYQSQVKLFLGK